VPLLISLLLGGCGSPNSEADLINETMLAVGGASLVEGVTTLMLEGRGESYNLGQGTSPDSELPMFEVTDYKLLADFSSRRWRREWVRTPRYPTGNPSSRNEVLAVDDSVAFDVGRDGTLRRAADLQGRIRQAELHHHPIGALQAAVAPQSRVSNRRVIENLESVDVMTGDGDEFTLYIETATKLPVRVQWTTYDINLGNVIAEMAFGGYENVDGLQLPTLFTSYVDRFKTAELTVTHAVNGDVGNLAAPDDVKSATGPAPRASVEVEEVSRGIWYLTGESHHSVVVEFADHLTLIEAPQNDLRSLAVIEKARGLNPDKPLTHVISTHHHFDHSGGIRAAISEGLTIITHEAGLQFYQDIASRSHSLSPDTLARTPQTLKIETIGEKTILSDSARTIEIYPIAESGHANTLLMVYFPAQRLLAFADVFTPATSDFAAKPRFPFVRNLVQNVQDYGLRVDRVLPMHGRMVPYSEVRAAVESEREPR
jgi:glyoxylase-like metal-dependent hydrolase (beta-lactamase superfamily II)